MAKSSSNRGNFRKRIVEYVKGVYAQIPEISVGKHPQQGFRLLHLSDMVFRTRFARLESMLAASSRLCRKTSV